MAALAVLLVTASRADEVVRRDGVKIRGTVVSVDADSVTVRTSSGPRTLARADVASILFGAIHPLRVEIRNVSSDDALDVLLDGEPLIADARVGGEWIDITGKLKDGNNALALRIHNDRGPWAYRFDIRINGRVFPVGCGTPRASGPGCRCCGKSGNEIGVIDDLPPVWINVDRAQGRAEILP